MVTKSYETHRSSTYKTLVNSITKSTIKLGKEKDFICGLLPHIIGGAFIGGLMHLVHSVYNDGDDDVHSDHEMDDEPSCPPPSLTEGEREQIIREASGRANVNTKAAYKTGRNMYRKYWVAKRIQNAAITPDGVIQLLKANIHKSYDSKEKWMKGLQDEFKTQAVIRGVAFKSLRDNAAISRLMKQAEENTANYKKKEIEDRQQMSVMLIPQNNSWTFLEIGCGDHKIMKLGMEPYTTIQTRWAVSSLLVA